MIIRDEDYYNWLCDKVNDDDFDISQYTTLLSRLYHTEFTWTIDDDANRAADGIDLRFEYANSIGVSSIDARIIFNHPCSVLEMMVALALKCENQLMEDLFVGPRVGRWFKVMLSSLGLRFEADGYYDEKYVDYIITSFLAREYNEDGDGGLFRTNDHTIDMRQLEIWYQMNVYLRELLQVG